MELRHLRYFVAVFESKSLRQASRRLHVAQSAVSKTLSSLEEEIDAKLLIRTSRHMQPTPEGEVFYKEALRTLAQWQFTI
jgi:DNA-binding transcriptional LysR family regulator